MPPMSPSVRPLILAAALLTPLAVTGCGSTELSPCDSPGDTFVQRLQVHHADDSWDEQVVFLVCTPDETVVIVDVNGDDYRSLAEFQTGNELFDYGDELLLRKDFPAVNTLEGETEDLEVMTVPARVSTAWVWWLVVGGAAVAAVVIAGPWYWLRRRRRTRQSRDADLLLSSPDDKPEPDAATT